MAERTVPQDLVFARRLECLADELTWNLSEQYIADGTEVLKGGNEIVSLYVRPSEGEAIALAEGMEELIGPIRRRHAVMLLDQIDALSAQIRALNEGA